MKLPEGNTIFNLRSACNIPFLRDNTDNFTQFRGIGNQGIQKQYEFYTFELVDTFPKLVELCAYNQSLLWLVLSNR